LAQESRQAKENIQNLKNKKLEIEKIKKTIQKDSEFTKRQELEILGLTKYLKNLDGVGSVISLANSLHSESTTPHSTIPSHPHPSHPTDQTLTFKDFHPSPQPPQKTKKTPPKKPTPQTPIKSPPPPTDPSQDPHSTPKFLPNKDPKFTDQSPNIAQRNYT
jgi:hypothetical protein